MIPGDPSERGQRARSQLWRSDPEQIRRVAHPRLARFALLLVFGSVLLLPFIAVAAFVAPMVIAPPSSRPAVAAHGPSSLPPLPEIVGVSVGPGRTGSPTATPSLLSQEPAAAVAATPSSRSDGEGELPVPIAPAPGSGLIVGSGAGSSAQPAPQSGTVPQSAPPGEAAAPAPAPPPNRRTGLRTPSVSSSTEADAAVAAAATESEGTEATDSAPTTAQQVHGPSQAPHSRPWEPAPPPQPEIAAPPVAVAEPSQAPSVRPPEPEVQGRGWADVYLVQPTPAPAPPNPPLIVRPPIAPPPAPPPAPPGLRGRNPFAHP